MASASFRASITHQVGEVHLFHRQWFLKWPDEDYGAARDTLFEPVRVFLQSDIDTQRGYEDCVERLQKIHNALASLHQEVRDRLISYRDDWLLDKFDEEYEPRMKTLKHVIEILHLKALLKELEE